MDMFSDFLRLIGNAFQFSAPLYPKVRNKNLNKIDFEISRKSQQNRLGIKISTKLMSEHFRLNQLWR